MKKITTIICVIIILCSSCKKDVVTQLPVPDTTGKYFVKRILVTAPLIYDDYYFTYNASNKIVEIDQKDYRKIKLEYNGNGLISKAVSSYYTGKIQAYTEYFYSGELLVKEIRHYLEEDSYNNSITYTQTFVYENENNKPKVIKTYNSSGALKATAVVNYDSSGNPFSITSSAGFTYTYQYSANDYHLLPGNEAVYLCLDALISFTYPLSFQTPADMNYYVPFSKEIAGVTQKMQSGQTRMQMQFSYQKNTFGFTDKMIARNLNEGDPSQYLFEYEKR